MGTKLKTVHVTLTPQSGYVAWKASGRDAAAALRAAFSRIGRVLAARARSEFRHHCVRSSRMAIGEMKCVASDAFGGTPKAAREDASLSASRRRDSCFRIEVTPLALCRSIG